MRSDADVGERAELRRLTARKVCGSSFAAQEACFALRIWLRKANIDIECTFIFTGTFAAAI